MGRRMSVLTFDMLQNAAQKAIDNSGKPDVMYVSKNTLNALIEWQKWENWLKTLSSERQICERTRARLKARKPHTVMNLPE
jgi:hypothetical protein